jgi:membrane-associated phospholipid phosphatase
LFTFLSFLEVFFMSRLIAKVLLDGTSFIVSSLAAGAMVYFHDGKALLLICGALLCRTIVISLKRVIKQPRPDLSKKKSEGFPSSHATLLSYFAVALAQAKWSDNTLWRLFLAVSCFILVAVRVQHSYHTSAQIAAGLLLGVSLSGLWSWVCNRYLTNHADVIAGIVWQYVLTQANATTVWF